jgi:hypothetical protein
VSPILSSETSSTKSDKIDELENSAMEVDEKSVGSRNSITDLDMTVRSGMIDSMNVRKPEVKKKQRWGSFCCVSTEDGWRGYFYTITFCLFLSL